MKVARHGSGAGAALRGLASQVHPVFMLPPVATAVFGSVLAPEFSLLLSTLYAATMFCCVYTAHVTDGYVDFHVRDEDDDHPLTPFGCAVGFSLGTLGYVACSLALFALVGLVPALVALPGWMVAVLHAPVLDTRPVTATAGYPFGIALALVGGYYVQAEELAPMVLAFAGVFLVVLSGIKVVDDMQDYDYDRSIEKRTVAVAVGLPGARRIAYALMAAGMVGVIAFAGLAVFPPSSVVAVAVFTAVAAVARRADAELATMLLVRGSYLFLAALVAAVWLRPLS